MTLFISWAQETAIYLPQIIGDLYRIHMDTIKPAISNPGKISANQMLSII